MKTLTLLAICLFALPSAIQGQDVTALPNGIAVTAGARTPQEARDRAQDIRHARGNRFHLATLVAIRLSVRDGGITRDEARDLRFGMLSSNYRNRAETLTVLQMAASDSADALPFGEDGRVVRAAIDWPAFTAFLKEFLPELIELLKLFGVI